MLFNCPCVRTVQLSEAQQRNEPITVTLPDGGQKPAVRGVTTPLDVASSLSKSLAKKVVVADVDGDKWDLFRPLEEDCRLQLFTFDDPKGKHVSNTSLAHLRASFQAAERVANRPLLQRHGLMLLLSIITHLVRRRLYLVMRASLSMCLAS